ncbi:CDP-2,3-bis-(O-geranylgeranyl)-sn-glycerol synthase [Methanobrevibacter filiformis]|uniref:CDP-archaeol synthase n=1 Tax=Methanobrevibacter filiformis TaxID=55758 RepID=A0A166CJV1_9EURY|nr:CDP-2,3-bis-(O-geranylgeranyl)-sn-glycerol synthase [Methanobrevibacter filiformis]KZX14585.1 hypothetical protein MBFIL_08230 [Methanobrevibacter filiformis]
MNQTINFLITCLSIGVFLLPAYIANLSGLAFGGETPLDLGKNFIDGRRILGNGVTWKGLIFGTIAGTIAGTIIGVLEGSVLYGFIVGLLLSFGSLTGDAVGSFIKRRLKIDQGRPAPIMDQLDFFVGALILVSLVVNIDGTTIIVGAIITLILHLSSNSVAYLLKIKDVWY